MDSLVNEYDDSHYYSENYDVFDEDEVVFNDVQSEIENINTKDYNLNSPLIFNKLEGFYSKLLNGHCNPLFSHKDHDRLLEFLKLTREPLRIYQGTKDSTQKIIASILRNYPVTKRGERFISQWLATAEKTQTFPDSFLQGWLGDTPYDFSLSVQKIRNMKYNHRRYMSLFMDFFLIVNLINSRSNRERDNLVKLLGGTLHYIGDLYLGCQTVFPILGRVLIMTDFIFCIDSGDLLDQNSLLLIKDTAVGRYNTFCFLNMAQIENSFDEEEKDRLELLYQLGDEMIISAGNQAFEGIKLIEAICNEAICLYTEKFRPEFPKFRSFSDHIRGEIQEKVKNGLNNIEQIHFLIKGEPNLNMVIVYYSVFRHWGHPFIDIEEGLEKLHSLVTTPISVNEDYVNALASDFAFKVLRSKYREKKVWYIDVTLMDKNSVLFDYVKNNAWPSQAIINKFGDNWHTLPLLPCYDLPEMVDIAAIYSDKSHSKTYSEVAQEIQMNPNRPIPTCRVLQTLIEEPAENWPLFLKEINDNGLSKEDLIIGLKPKEREEKRIGRYFALMSWKLRQYFVYTEHIIKTHFVPLVKGLTMADDLHTLIEKMLDSTCGQGSDSYQYISIANGIDYQKWNNLQRYESTEPIFTVMGKFIGYPKLFSRTHKFFQESFVYFPDRPDRMYVNNGTINGYPGEYYCWQGQAGGFEGLRQKGWSIISCLMIEREGRCRNTQVSCLAQGDNQIIITKYKTDSWSNLRELKTNLLNIYNNNACIIESVRKGAANLGLIINEDETIQSIEYLNYGKIPIIRGKIIGLPPKRWSRVTCCTNDQLPSAGNLLSSVSTAALMVSHFCNSPLDAMYCFHLFGCMVLSLSKCHNPALRGSPSSFIKDHDYLNDPLFTGVALYLDPSLGGIGGTSSTRFMIRLFPDFVTESLTFWKLIYKGTSSNLIKSLCVIIGNPSIAAFNPSHFEKLIENPGSLNIIRGVSSSNLLKTKIKESLNQNAERIKNKIIRDAAIYNRDKEPELMAWLESINPLFPRFISEYANSTYYGMNNSLLGLISNSRTMRKVFKNNFGKEIDDVIIRSEIISLSSIIRILKTAQSNPDCFNDIWECSASHADKLREISWGRRVYGMTVPHPAEMFQHAACFGGECKFCELSGSNSTYITTLAPKGVRHISIDEPRGPYPPYLGSKTKEGTSILQPWEKETNLPLMRRASDLRRVISWFVDPDTNLAKSILNNLASLTGESWEGRIEGFKRTGSALHRFQCSRVENGGFAACSPTPLCWLIVTTDTLSGLDQNYDFMYQPSMIYSQLSTICMNNCTPTVYHSHISCQGCIREIEDITLDAGWEYCPEDVSQILSSWMPPTTSSWINKERTRANVASQICKWEINTNEEKSFHIGLSIGFCFADITLGSHDIIQKSDLFPLVIQKKMEPYHFIRGILRGLVIGGALHLTQRRSLLMGPKSHTAVMGIRYFLIEEITQDPKFIHLMSNGPLNEFINMYPHKVPSSYPLTTIDSGSIIRGVLKRMTKDNNFIRNPDLVKPWVFSDMQSSYLLGSFGLAVIADRIIKDGLLSKVSRTRLQELQRDYIDILNDRIHPSNLEYYLGQLLPCPSELRHASKEMPDVTSLGPSFSANHIWNFSIKSTCYRVPLRCSSNPAVGPIRNISKHWNPSVSSLRLFQCATGAHYKIDSILNDFNILPLDCLCGGDGSGGITSLLLRKFQHSKVIFNSLLCAEGIRFLGSHPSPPSAVSSLGSLSSRCVNYNDVWRNPSDLRLSATWAYFRRLKDIHNLKITLMIFDMEVQDLSSIIEILHLLSNNLSYILEERGSLIFKTYLSSLLSRGEDNPLYALERWFDQVDCVTCDYSSTKTSEFYLVCQRSGLKPYPVSYPTLDFLDDLWNISFINSDLKDEYQRITKIKKMLPSLSGIPTNLVPDWRVDLSTLLVITGLESGISSDLSDQLSTQTGEDAIGGLYAVLCLLNQSTFKVWTYSESKYIPSNSLIDKFFSAYIGIMISLSIWGEDFEGFCALDSFINNSVLQKIILNWRHQKSLVCTSWSFHHKNHLQGLTKHINISRLSASIGHWARVANFIISESQMSRIPLLKNCNQKCDNIIHRYYKKGNMLEVIKKTDTFYFTPSSML